VTDMAAASFHMSVKGGGIDVVIRGAFSSSPRAGQCLRVGGYVCVTQRHVLQEYKANCWLFCLVAILIIRVLLSFSSPCVQAFPRLAADPVNMSHKDDVPILPLANTSSLISSPTTITANSPPPSPTKEPFSIRNELRVFVGEFLGTFTFLFLAFAGTQVALTAAAPSRIATANENLSQQVSKVLYISFAFGAALAVAASIFVDVCGAMFNPAVSTCRL
jgi:hypothetical protein